MPFISKARRLEMELEGDLPKNPEDLAYCFYCILGLLAPKDIDKSLEMTQEVIEAYVFENGLSMLTQAEILGSFFLATMYINARVGDEVYMVRFSDNTDILFSEVADFFDTFCVPYLEALRKKHGDIQYGDLE